MKNNTVKIERDYCMKQNCYSEVVWNYPIVEHKIHIVLTFIDYIDGLAYTKAYKTGRGAQCAETKFFNAMNRKEAQREKERMIELYGGKNK